MAVGYTDIKGQRAKLDTTRNRLLIPFREEMCGSVGTVTQVQQACNPSLQVLEDALIRDTRLRRVDFAAARVALRAVWANKVIMPCAAYYHRAAAGMVRSFLHL